MYTQHFNLSALPFSIAPNPRYLYLSSQHREALAHLLYGLSLGGGFVALTGEVGTGKTTLCRCLLEQLPEDVDIALIFNPRLSAQELLASLCDELRIAHPDPKASIKELIDRLNHHLLETHARGRRTVVLIDEAQNLSFDVLEQIRLLTNLETNESKLLQIILVGQPELRSLLDKKDLRQLAQRITARYHLQPLSRRDCAAYIHHRLAVCGAQEPIFTASALAQVYRLSAGIPRLINLICDRALLGAYTLGRHKVGVAIVRKAAREVLPASSVRRPLHPAIAATAALTLLLATAFSVFEDSAPWLFDRLFSPHGQDIGRDPPSAGAAVAAPQATLDASPEPSPLRVAAAILAAPAGVVETTPAPAVDAKADDTAVNSEPSSLPNPVAAPSTAPDLGLALADPGLGRRAAMSELLKLWGMLIPVEAADECLFAKQQGLRCLAENGGLDRLKKIDHPAMLELVIPGGAKRYVTLVAAQGDTLRLQLGPAQREVRREQLTPYWPGGALLLWKPPHNDASVGQGDANETVRWVRERLRMPAAPGQDAAHFDENLMAKVLAFQQQHGLLADGRVGPQTMIQLDHLDHKSGGPRLNVTLD